MSAVNGALHGLKVIDLSRVLGGPYCTQALADHGAQVIKLEPPVGDETRTWGPPFDESDTAWYFNGVNRNKLGISVDLSCDEGRAVLWQLLEDADVLVENFKPGTLARWGMDFERDLQPRFPRLIHCAVSGFGPDGPLGGLPGYDAAIQAMAGLMSVNGEREGGPMRVGLPIVDMVTGLNALAGILLALAFPSHPENPLAFLYGPAWAWIALSPLLAGLGAVGGLRSAFRLGATAGFVFNLLSLYWIGHTQGGGAAVVVGAALGAAWLSLFTGAFATLQSYLLRHVGQAALLAAPVLWTAAWVKPDTAATVAPAL